MPEPRSRHLPPRRLQRVGDARVLFVDQRHELARTSEAPGPRHRLELLAERGQPRRPEHPPVGLKRVRRATQLVRIGVLERASKRLDQRRRIEQEGVDELENEGAIAALGTQLLERFWVQDTILVSRWRGGLWRLRRADGTRGAAAQGVGA